jgi:hypothetical protein
MAQPAKADLSEFYRLSKPKRKPCSIGFALEQLEAKEKEKLETALAIDQGIITNAAIEGWLKARGLLSTVSAVVNHRKGRCTCVER